MSTLRLTGSVGPIVDAVTGPRFIARAGRWLAGTAIFVAVIELVFSTSVPDFISGLALGSLYGIIGVGIVLIYRTSRIINFAAGAIGAVPAIIALLLVLQHHVDYLVALPIALVGGPILGALTDIVVMRRFDRTPRIIATVITIGVAQSFAVLGSFLPVWLGAEGAVGAVVPTPWANVVWHNGRGQPLLTGNEIAAFVTVCVVTLGLAAFLRYSRVGIALRAAADNADRALMLGIPVRRVRVAAWALAGLLAALAIFVQAPLIGSPSNATLGFDTLLYALAAAVVSRMERFGLTLAAGMGIGVLVTSSIISSGDNSVSSSLMVIVILGALLMQPRRRVRAFDTSDGTWQTVKQHRPVPAELRSLPEVIVARWGILAAIGGVVLALPYLVGADNTSYLVLLPLYGIVAVSLVVLTGWAGQISLGQFGLVGASAGVAGGLIANHNIDFFAALGVGIVTGVVAAVVVGLPSLRMQGLYLAVTTLAFGYAVPNYFLNEHYWLGRHILPSGLGAHLDRPLLYGRIDLSGDRAFYYLCLVLLALVVLAALAFRRNRSGRVLIAQSDNPRAATAYAINPARARLAAFVVSGGIAGLAGVLFDYAQQNVVPGTYGVQASILVFLIVAIAGISSVPFAVVGAMLFEAAVTFGPRIYNLLHSQTLTSTIPLLLTGPLLILNAYFSPGGSAETGMRVRDDWLRRVARRRGMVVPSLITDATAEMSAVTAARLTTDSADVTGHVDSDVLPVSVPVSAPALWLTAGGDGHKASR